MDISRLVEEVKQINSQLPEKPNTYFNFDSGMEYHFGKLSIEDSTSTIFNADSEYKTVPIEMIRDISQAMLEGFNAPGKQNKKIAWGLLFLESIMQNKNLLEDTIVIKT